MSRRTLFATALPALCLGVGLALAPARPGTTGSGHPTPAAAMMRGAPAAAGTSALKGPPWISIEYPPSPYDRGTRDALPWLTDIRWRRLGSLVH